MFPPAPEGARQPKRRLNSEGAPVALGLGPAAVTTSTVVGEALSLAADIVSGTSLSSTAERVAAENPGAVPEWWRGSGKAVGGAAAAAKVAAEVCAKCASGEDREAKEEE